jgi:hypothetical protein
MLTMLLQTKNQIPNRIIKGTYLGTKKTNIGLANASKSNVVDPNDATEFYMMI